MGTQSTVKLPDAVKCAFNLGLCFVLPLLNTLERAETVEATANNQWRAMATEVQTRARPHPLRACACALALPAVFPAFFWLSG